MLHCYELRDRRNLNMIRFLGLKFLRMPWKSNISKLKLKKHNLLKNLHSGYYIKRRLYCIIFQLLQWMMMNLIILLHIVNRR